MLSRILKSIRLAQTVATRRTFTTNDWSKDRERAAEKEFMMREEKRKMQDLKKKIKEDRMKNLPLAEDELDIDEVLADREFLIVELLADAERT